MKTLSWLVGWWIAVVTPVLGQEDPSTPIDLPSVSDSSATDTVPREADTAGVPLTRFPIGEQLRYDAKFGIIPVGAATMSVLEVDTLRGVPVLHLQFRLEGGTFFYRLDDKLDSWVGLEDFASRRFVQDFDEGGKTRYSEYLIYPDSGFYRQVGIDSTMETLADPLDDTAFFYFIRTVDLEVGERYEFNRYFKPDRNPVVLEVLEQDTLDVPAGRFPSLVVRPIIKGRGIFAETRQARMWISDDERRIMVQLKVRFPFGTITLRLKEDWQAEAQAANP